jgi:hypothetical protein
MNTYRLEEVLMTLEEIKKVAIPACCKFKVKKTWAISPPYLSPLAFKLSLSQRDEEAFGREV